MYDVRQFKPALYALVLLGITGFALATGSGGLWVASVVLIFLNLAWVASDRFRPLPRPIANLLVVAAAAYVAFRVTGEGSPVVIIGQFLVILQVIKLYEQRANRDFGQLIVLSLLLMVAAAISTASLSFGLLLVLYLFLSLYCCLLFHLKVETDAARRNMRLSDDRPADVRQLRQDQRRLGSSMRRLTALVSAVAVTCAVIVFLAFPRGSGAHLADRGPQFRSSQAVSGFNKQVSFQDIARITQNNTPVAYVQIFRNGHMARGGETLFLRGNTLDVYVSDPLAVDRWTWRESSDRVITYNQGEPIGPSFPLGPLIDRPPMVIEQRFEVEPVGLDVLPALGGAFLVTLQQQSFSHSSGDNTMGLPTQMRRPFRYTVWSTGNLNRGIAQSPGDLETDFWIETELVRLRQLHDQAELMRRATLRQLAGEAAGSQETLLAEARARQSESGLLVPSRLLGRISGHDAAGVIEQAALSVDEAAGRLEEDLPYPAPMEIIRFAMDPEVSGLDESGQSLAEQRLARSGTTEFDERIARNIAFYLQSRYSYTLDISDARMSAADDPLAWFVSEDGRRGHCEFFAGTAALACQALGIPARVVVGFKSSEFNGSLDKFVVRQSHAHAWVEVLTERGWITLDPTSGNGDDLARDEPDLLDRVQHWFEFLEYTWANNVITYDNGARTDLLQSFETDMLMRAHDTAGLWDRFKAWLERQNLYIYSAQLMAWLLVAMVVSAVGVLLWFAWDRWRLRRRARRIGLGRLSADEAQRLARQLAFFDDLLRLLERHGHRRRPEQTPREFALSLACLPRQAFDTVVSMTDIFYRVRYGQARVTPRRQRLLGRSLDRLAATLSRSA